MVVVVVVVCMVPENCHGHPKEVEGISKAKDNFKTIVQTKTGIFMEEGNF